AERDHLELLSPQRKRVHHRLRIRSSATPALPWIAAPLRELGIATTLSGPRLRFSCSPSKDRCERAQSHGRSRRRRELLPPQSVREPTQALRELHQSPDH